MYYERKLRDKRKIIWLLGLGLLFMMITLMHTDKIMAATSSEDYIIISGQIRQYFHQRRL